MAGEYACNDAMGGYNAFAAHYVISPENGVAKTKVSLCNAGSLRYSVSRSKVHFSISNPDLHSSKMFIYDASG